MASRRRGGDDRVEVLVGLRVEQCESGGVGCGTPSTCRTPPRTVRPSTGSAGATITSPPSAAISAATFPRSSESIFLNVIRPSSARTLRAASVGRERARVEVDDVAVGVAERDPPRTEHRGRLHGTGEVVGDHEHRRDPAR